MGDAFRKVQPGQPLAIPAAAYNAFVDAAIGHRQTRGGGRALPSSTQSGEVVLVRNDTEDRVERWSVLGVDGPVVVADDVDETVVYPFAFVGVVPEARHRGRFVVTIEPISAGQIGRASIGGVVVVDSDEIGIQGNGFYDVEPGDVTRLKATPDGSAYAIAGHAPSSLVYLRLGLPTSGIVQGRISAVSGADGDNAGAVTYSAESLDGTIELMDRSPMFRAYGDEVPVNVAEIDSACLIMVTEAGAGIAFCLETFATETCDGEAAYVFGLGPDNRLSLDLMLVAQDGTVAVTVGGNVAVAAHATLSQSAAFDRIAVGVDSSLLVDQAGTALVTYDGSVLVHPDAFRAILFDLDGDVLLHRDGDRVAASPMIAPGVAAPSVRSARSEVVRFEAFREAGSPTPIITGSRGGNVALANLLSALDSAGIITNNTTA